MESLFLNHLRRNIWKYMKSAISLSIPTPCAENWNNFTPADKGRFCSACSKVVVDFTSMTDAQLLNYLQQRKGECCGKFRKDQLKTFHPEPKPSPIGSLILLKAGLAGLLMLLLSRQSNATEINTRPRVEQVQTPTRLSNDLPTDSIRISGIVKDEYGVPLPGIYIILQGTTTGIASNADGKFEFPKLLTTGDVLLFSFIGYESQTYVIKETADRELQITMQMNIEMMMGAVAVTNFHEEPTGLKKFWIKVKGFFGA